MKNEVRKVLHMASIAVAMTAFSCFAASASPVVEVGKAPEISDQQENCTQMITVVGNGMDNSSVLVSYYKKLDEGSWANQFSVSGYCGHDGIAALDNKKEGDRRTPAGTYRFVSAFGTEADPGSRIFYKQVDVDDYWVDDIESNCYNQMVNTKYIRKDWTSAEHLIDIVPQYHYSLVLDYNTSERIPGKGSAIFLHGYHSWKTWTEGCIAIPEENMKLLIQNVDEYTQIIIVPDVYQLPKLFQC